MRSRFVTKKTSYFRNIFFSAIIFVGIFLVFILGISRVTERSEAEKMHTLERAIYDGAVHCYAIEGQYPESLEYLVDNYDIYYDTEDFFVDYRSIGTNIPPVITVLSKADWEK